MGMLRKAVFWLTMLFFVFFAAVEALSLPECNQLKEEMLKDKLNFINCADKKMMIPEVNNTYPVADFSNFTQEEFDNMTDVKTILGKPEPDEDRLFCGNFLAKNSDLTNIKLGFYVVKQDGPPQSFVLESNHHLENVTITTTTIDKDFHLNMTFTIKNNKRLSNESLEALRAIDYYNNKTSYIQQFGECDLDKNGISSLENLEDCHYTLNDLVINRKTVLAATKTLDLTVKGCIRINNTEIKDLNVISTITKTNCSGSHEIVNNKKLCLHPEEISNLKKRFGKVDYKNNSDCLGECTPKYLLDKKDPTCEIITGTLNITKLKVKDNLKHFANIQEIRGRLQMRENELTDLSIGTLFPKLKLINGSYDKEYHTLSLQYNLKLQNFTIPENLSIITPSDVRVKAVYISENGNFSMSEDATNTLTEKFGKGRFSHDKPLPKPPVQQIIRVKENSTSDASNDIKEEKTSWVLWLSIACGVLVVLLILSALGFVTYMFYKASKTRNKIMQEQRTYEVTEMINLQVPEATPLISFPESTTKPWMHEAYEVLKNNANLIANQEKERLQRKARNAYVQRNSVPNLPLYSRNDNKNKVFMHEIKKWKSLIYACKNEGCQKNGKKAHMYCVELCNCKDEGIIVKGNHVFGVRMEKQFDKWAKYELEKCHQNMFQCVDAPITYEEVSISTMKTLEETSSRYIEGELKFWDQHNIKQETGINADEIDFKEFDKFLLEEMKKELKKGKEKEKNTIVEKEETTKEEIMGCNSKIQSKNVIAYVTRYKMVLYHYNPALNSLGDVTAFSTNRKPPTIYRCLREEFKKETSYAVQIFQDMISAHMNCSVGSWVTNYTHDDIISLCEKVKDVLDTEDCKAKAYVEVKEINVRIIGEVRGKFDDLRKALCLKSANSKKFHPILETRHVFLGNYVGSFGQNMEVLCLLFALKALYPDKYVLLRGAMEWRQMGDISGLKTEVFTRFAEEPLRVWDAINEVFDMLPLVCKVGGNVLCTHAGVAPRMEDVKTLSLPITMLEPDTLPFNMMFAQPNWTVKRFFDNVEQKAGYYFGREALDTALKNFECELLFCTKTLVSGFGVLGAHKRLFTVCGYQKKGTLAQAEFDSEGGLEIQVLYITQQEKIVYSTQKPYNLNRAEKEQTKSRIFGLGKKDNKGKGNDHEKSTLSVVKKQADSVKDAPPADTSSQNPSSQNAPSKSAAPQAPSSGSKT